MITTLEITKSHPRLDWLRGIQRTRRVPSHVAQQMSGLKSMEQAQDFVRKAGLKVLTDIRRSSDSVNSVTIASFQEQDTFYRPQIVLPQVDCAELPFGSAMMNFLVPEISDRAGAERIFEAHQKMVLAFSEKVKALPFACITGRKMNETPHDLYSRGFRFFFGPAPDRSYKRILELLQAKAPLFSPDSSREEREAAATACQKLKFCKINGQKMGHSILEDVKFYDLPITTLADLR
jgi:hypothetical protein